MRRRPLLPLRLLAAVALVGAAGICGIFGIFGIFGLGACSDSPRTAIDAAIDTAAGACDSCSASQICVARYDGTCHASVACVARTVDCPNNACSAACESTYCGAPFQCQTRSPCGGEPAHAFTCYGP
jgi:hypothetical protein